MRVALARPLPTTFQLAEARRSVSPDDSSAGLIGQNDSARTAVAPEVASARQSEARNEELDKALDWLNGTAERLPSEVRFSIHRATGQIMVRVVDGKGNLIREVPPERALDAYAMMAKLFGLLVDQTA